MGSINLALVVLCLILHYIVTYIWAYLPHDLSLLVHEITSCLVVEHVWIYKLIWS